MQPGAVGVQCKLTGGYQLLSSSVLDHRNQQKAIDPIQHGIGGMVAERSSTWSYYQGMWSMQSYCQLACTEALCQLTLQ